MKKNRLINILIPTILTSAVLPICTSCNKSKIQKIVASKKDDFLWVYNDDNTCTCYGLSEELRMSYYKQVTEISIPESIENDGKTYRVTRIGDRAFGQYNPQRLEKATIPSSIVEIGKSAFTHNTNLKIFIIPEDSNLKLIDNECFEQCYLLGSINIPKSVTTINRNAFYACKMLKNVSIPAESELQYIGDMAFDICDLNEVFIPKKVQYIGNQAFSWLKNADKIVVDEQNTKFSSNNTNSVIEISSNKLIFGCKNTTINDGIQSINSFAFYGCENLKQISIPKSVIDIGVNAFGQCMNLEYINVDSNNTIYKSTNSLGNNCNCIQVRATREIFAGCKNTTIPDDAVSIGDYAFNGCKLLTSLFIPSNITAIKDSSFESCYGLTSLTLPDSISYIGYQTFIYCKNLKKINIPKNVYTIKGQIFRECDSLIEIDWQVSLSSSLPSGYSTDVFYGLNHKGTIYTPNQLTTDVLKKYCYEIKDWQFSIK